MTAPTDLRSQLAEAVWSADEGMFHDRVVLRVIDAVLAVVGPEVDRLRAEIDRARAMANQRPCGHDLPHQCHLHLNGRTVHHCPGVLVPEE